jgi:hypothetical protein
MSVYPLAESPGAGSPELHALDARARQRQNWRGCGRYALSCGHLLIPHGAVVERVGPETAPAASLARQDGVVRIHCSYTAPNLVELVDSGLQHLRHLHAIAPLVLFTPSKRHRHSLSRKFAMVLQHRRHEPCSSPPSPPPPYGEGGVDRFACGIGVACDAVQSKLDHGDIQESNAFEGHTLSILGQAKGK